MAGRTVKIYLKAGIYVLVGQDLDEPTKAACISIRVTLLPLLT